MFNTLELKPRFIIGIWLVVYTIVLSFFLPFYAMGIYNQPKKINKISNSFSIVQNKTITPNKLKKFNISINHDGKKRTAFDILSYNNISFDQLINVWPELAKIDNESREQIEIESKYKSYLISQK